MISQGPRSTGSCRFSVESTSPLEVCAQVQLKGLRSWLAPKQIPPRLPASASSRSCWLEPSFRGQSQTMNVQYAWGQHELTLGGQWRRSNPDIVFSSWRSWMSLSSLSSCWPLRPWAVNFSGVNYKELLQRGRDETSLSLDHGSTSFCFPELWWALDSSRVRALCSKKAKKTHLCWN